VGGWVILFIAPSSANVSSVRRTKCKSSTFIYLVTMIKEFKWGLSVNKWSNVKCSDVEWSGMSYGEILGDESTMYIRVTLYWGYLIVLWLFHLLCVLYCGCFNLFCNVWVNVYVCVCVCVFGGGGVFWKVGGGFGVWGGCFYFFFFFLFFVGGWCFDNCVGVLVLCVLVFTVLFVLCFCFVMFIYIYSYLFFLY